MQNQNVPLPDDWVDAITAVLRPGEDRTAFLRSAIRRELKARKSPATLSDVGRRGRPPKAPAAQ